MNLNRLKYFIVLAETKNITQAAAKLYMAQPNLSKQLSLFEEEIGVKLFTRSHSGIELTLEGEMIYDRLRHVPSLIETTIERAKCQAQAHTIFRIGLLEGFDFVHENIRKLKERYPDYQFILERRSFSELNNKLLSGRYDAIITMGWGVNDYLPDNIIGEKIKPLDIGILIAANHPLAQAGSISALHECSFIALDEHNSPESFQLLQIICSKNGITPHDYYFVENFEDLLLNVETNMSVAITASNNGLRSKAEILTIPVVDDGTFQEVICWDSSNKNPVVQDLVRVFRENA